MGDLLGKFIGESVSYLVSFLGSYKGVHIYVGLHLVDFRDAEAVVDGTPDARGGSTMLFGESAARVKADFDTGAIRIGRVWAKGPMVRKLESVVLRIVGRLGSKPKDSGTDRAVHTIVRIQ